MELIDDFLNNKLSLNAADQIELKTIIHDYCKEQVLLALKVSNRPDQPIEVMDQTSSKTTTPSKKATGTSAPRKRTACEIREDRMT